VLAYSDGAEIRASRSAARDIEITFRQGDAMLAGTLILPEGVGPHPAIILLHGSGPLTRYSFGPYARFFNSLGLAVLVYDKRGTGSSSGRLLDASTGAPEILWQAHFPDDLLADSLAAARFLQSRPDIDGRRIGVWGSSEGGMLATQVAAKSRNIAFAVNSSGFIGPLWRTILYQGEGGMRAAGKAEADIARALEFNRFWMEVARTGKGYDDYLQRRDILIKAGAYDQLFYYSASYRSLAQMRWSWEHILAFDSSQALSNITCPVLGLFGAADMLTEVQIAASGMRAKAPTAVTHIIPNASHSLMEVPSRQGMAPGVFDTLAEWLRQVAIA
jgi:pimeloyl-ACP methyl ester carboxylesterase